MNYLPYYRKKLERLARKERDLLRLLERHGTDEKVAIAAEGVRASRIRALEARQSQIPECEANADRINSIDEDISSCLHLSIADIIASCQHLERANVHYQKPR
jgi:hypothetical protein